MGKTFDEVEWHDFYVQGATVSHAYGPLGCKPYADFVEDFPEMAWVDEDRQWIIPGWTPAEEGDGPPATRVVSKFFRVASPAEAARAPTPPSCGASSCGGPSVPPPR